MVTHEELHRELDTLEVCKSVKLHPEQLHRIRRDLAYADPEDFPEGYSLIRIENSYRFNQRNTQRIILKHKDTGAFLRVSVKGVIDGELHSNDVRQVEKTYEIRSVYKESV